MQIERSVLADWMGRTGTLIAPVVDRMPVLLKTGCSRLCVDETTAPVLDPGRGRTKTSYLWAVLCDDRGWNGPAAPGVFFHYHPGRKGEYANKLRVPRDDGHLFHAKVGSHSTGSWAGLTGNQTA